MLDPLECNTEVVQAGYCDHACIMSVSVMKPAKERREGGSEHTIHQNVPRITQTKYTFSVTVGTFGGLNPRTFLPCVAYITIMTMDN